MTGRWAYLFAGIVATSFAPAAQAAQPLEAGDVPTADKHHAEWYVGYEYRRDKDGIERQLPFSEMVFGVSNWQELTFEIPYLSLTPSQAQRASGCGDGTLGTKVMFLNESERRPGMALSFEAKLKNASQSRGLGSGAVDYGLLWRTQKTWGWFTGIMNLGRTFVGEPQVGGVTQPKRDVWFGAFAQFYELSQKTSLLSEIYWKNSDTPGEPSTLAGDVGFKYQFAPALQAHASAGRSLREGNLGGPKLRLYVGVKLEFDFSQIE